MSTTSLPTPRSDAAEPATARRPRLGFLGTGWIGRHRLQSIAESGRAEIVAIADPDADCLAQAGALAPGAARHDSLDALLALDLDGLVIATPSALHAAQSIRALQHGLAVFCQKPLARNAAECRRVIESARAADRLLGVDLSYRHTQAARALRELVVAGELGEVFAADLTFHNAYGPDKPWFRDIALAGGGCLIDLGTHLVDLAFWLLGGGEPIDVRGRLFARGEPLERPATVVEDYALVEFELAGAAVRLACSWDLHAGADAVIEVALYGTAGGARLRNVNGSFYDFVAEHLRGTKTERLCSPPDAWGGRAAVDWAVRLGTGNRYDPAIERVTAVAAVLDRVYDR